MEPLCSLSLIEKRGKSVCYGVQSMAWLAWENIIAHASFNTRTIVCIANEKGSWLSSSSAFTMMKKESLYFLSKDAWVWAIYRD